MALPDSCIHAHSFVIVELQAAGFIFPDDGGYEIEWTGRIRGLCTLCGKKSAVSSPDNSPAWVKKAFAVQWPDRANGGLDA